MPLICSWERTEYGSYVLAGEDAEAAGAWVVGVGRGVLYDRLATAVGVAAE